MPYDQSDWLVITKSKTKMYYFDAKIPTKQVVPDGETSGFDFHGLPET